MSGEPESTHAATPSAIRDERSERNVVTRTIAPHTVVAATNPSIRTPIDALRLDEIGRVRIFARLMILLALFGAALIPVVGGDPIARDVYFATLAAVVLAYTGLLWLTKDPARYTEALVGYTALLCSVSATGMQYFFGVYSPAAIVTGIGLLLYSMGSGFRWTFMTYVSVAAGHGLLAGLMLAGVMTDRGLINGDHVELRHRVIVQICVQFVYLISFVAGRASRRKTLEVLTQLEAAVRDVAERDALLAEARQEIERAGWVGGEGRYTDQRVGSFKLATVIGRGAMGEVYAAEHVTTGEEAALKLLHRNSLANPKYVSRFAREASIASALDVPNVVRVLEVSDENAALPYIAMERLHGADLAEILHDRHRLALDELVDLLRQVGKGLASAHTAGIVHRDIKPHNLFAATLGGDRVWKILDFGVSKLGDSTGTLTEGHLVGTPAYMAPEQARGGTVDHRIDLYALAAVAYRCVTGRPPVVGGNDIPRLLYAVVHEMPPRPSALVAGLVADVDDALAIGLAKSPTERFANATELADAVRDAVAGKLNSGLRRRAAALTARHPWSVTR